MIVSFKRDKPHWGARKIRELLTRRLASDVRVPARSTIHTVVDRHGLVKRMGKDVQDWVPVFPVNYLEHVPTKLHDFVEEDMLQHIESARFLFGEVIPLRREAR